MCNVISDIGLRKCLNKTCPSEKALAVLKAHNLIRKFKGFDVPIDPTSSSWTKDNGDKIIGGYEILHNLCTIDGKYDRDLHVAVEGRMVKAFVSYTEMQAFRRQSGHIGLLHEVVLNPKESHNMAFRKVAKRDTWDAIMDAADSEPDTLHTDRTYLACPYCGSLNIITDRGKTITEEFNPADDPETLNPECNYYEMETKPVLEKDREWQADMYLYKKDIILDLQELWDAREAEAKRNEISYDYLPQCIADYEESGYEPSYVVCVA